MLKKISAKVFSLFKNMQKPQRNKFIVLVSIVVIIIISVTLILGQTSYSVLYSGMDPADAGEVLALLEEMDVEVKTRATIRFL